MKKRGDRSYTERETCIMRALLLAGRPVKVIAETVGHPLGGVYKKIRAMGWSSRRRSRPFMLKAPEKAKAPNRRQPRKRWTPLEVSILRALLKRGRPYDVIASVLPGRDVGAVREKARNIWWAPHLKGPKTMKIRNGVLTGPTRDISRKGRDHAMRRAARITGAARC